MVDNGKKKDGRKEMKNSKYGIQSNEYNEMMGLKQNSHDSWNLDDQDISEFTSTEQKLNNDKPSLDIV
eukprot:CAMPEP_0170550448 /NCGR_PEP_ID=MMETSP0211-20121228/8510_1 /TAXON_ID=311385 /ORGANISM="Pseudokeronopsis sp., Strain OXSARD2" /LENGTH=67 /DNA_ID=CAMNT_0010857005 /DNA_START=403 /DNA_END=606 /DNA_ORIENTATION=-